MRAELLLESVDEDNEDDSEAMLPIGELSAVAQHVPTVEASRQRVVEEMESMVARGLDELVRIPASPHALTAHHSSTGQPTTRLVAPDGAQSVGPPVARSESAARLDGSCLEESQILLRYRVAVKRDGSCRFVCLQTIITSVLKRSVDGSPSTSSAFVYKSRARNEPTTVTLPQWTGAMWIRIEELLSMLGACCIKVRSLVVDFFSILTTLRQVYTLEKVLQLKRDQNTQSSFLEEAMTVS